MNTMDGLGKLIYEVKTMPLRLGILCLLMAAVLGAGGVYFLNQTPAPSVTTSATLLALGGIALLAPLGLPGQKLRFFEGGLTRTEPLASPLLMAHEAVERLTWSIIWPGLGLTITGRIVGAGHRFDFMVRLLDSSSPLRARLDAVREGIAQSVAARALQGIQSGRPFEWGSNRGPRARLQEDGLAFRATRFVGAAEERLVPWTAGLTCAIDRGVCHVHAAGEERQLFALACSEENFYPGLHVFTSLGTMRSRR